MAVSILAPLEVPTSTRAITLQLNSAIDAVAAKLVNTRSVCRSSYIHPAVLEDFRAGRLGDVLRLRKTTSERLLNWMDEEEIRVLRWLKMRPVDSAGA
jgi:DNA topoisomerase-1